MLNLDHILESASQLALSGRFGVVSHNFVAAIRQREEQLGHVALDQLRMLAEEARTLVSRYTPDAPQAQVAAFSIMCEAVRRACGVRLFDVQLQAARALSQGAIVEMQTGEGKTLACAPAAFLHSLTGRGVHIATPNTYLARRDFELLRDAYQLLGMSVGLLPERGASPAEKRLAYACDITYGTGYEFGFDYLRDQLFLREASRRCLGAATIESLVDAPATKRLPIQRGLYYSIVDEADHVLLDDAMSPLILSGGADATVVDAEVYRGACQVISKLQLGEHFRASGSGDRIRLTDAGIDLIHNCVTFPVECLQRTWTEYIEHALHAAALRRDVHYVVTPEKKVQIVDTTTGRILGDRTWREGLHQAVEAKEGLPITSERTSLAQITRQRFSRLYERLSGMTGTATGCDRELQQVYGLRVVPIPLRMPSRRTIWPTRFFTTQSQKWYAIVRSVQEVHEQQRPVLVGTTNIADCEYLVSRLRELGLRILVLNGLKDADEAAIVALAGYRATVTVATNLAGRGTDIKLGSGVGELGGLHVVVAECSESVRVDRQLIGRCGRQGDPGSAQMFVSAEDPLIQKHGAWLAQSIVRYAGPSGESRVDFSRQIGRIQRSAERANYAARSRMLRRDLSRDSLFSSQTLDP